MNEFLKSWNNDVGFMICICFSGTILLCIISMILYRFILKARVIDIYSKNNDLRLVKTNKNYYNVQQFNGLTWKVLYKNDIPLNLFELSEAQEIYMSEIKKRDSK